jgi:hypothetical protein
MSETLTIMFDDLSSEAQKEVLAFYGYATAAEGNLDVTPLFVLEMEDRKEQQHEPLQGMDPDQAAR